MFKKMEPQTIRARFIHQEKVTCLTRNKAKFLIRTQLVLRWFFYRIVFFNTVFCSF